jgi:AcrR family transcriptional regulator
MFLDGCQTNVQFIARFTSRRFESWGTGTHAQALSSRGQRLLMTSRPRGRREGDGTLAARILDEARSSFAERGVAGTTVRDVARAAQVDPALIYHFYSSKAGLLDAATAPPQAFLDFVAAGWASPHNDIGGCLVSRTLTALENEHWGPIIRAVLQIAAYDSDILSRLRKLIEQSLMSPSQLGLSDHDRRTRGNLITSQLLGLAFVRYIWKLEPLASMSHRDLVGALAANVQRYVDGDIGPTTQGVPISGP